MMFRLHVSFEVWVQLQLYTMHSNLFYKIVTVCQLNIHQLLVYKVLWICRHVKLFPLHSLDHAHSCEILGFVFFRIAPKHFVHSFNIYILFIERRLKVKIVLLCSFCNVEFVFLFLVNYVFRNCLEIYSIEVASPLLFFKILPIIGPNVDFRGRLCAE